MDNDDGSAFIVYLPDTCSVFRLSREFQRNSFADYHGCTFLALLRGHAPDAADD